jgi:hypothetical protein
LSGFSVRSILIVLVLVNVVWAAWSAATRGGHTDSVGSSPRAPRSGASGLALLSELPAPLPKVVSQPVPEESLLEADVPVNERDNIEVSANLPRACIAVGPFHELTRVETLRDEILDDGGSAAVVEEEIAGQPDYLVYIATAGSRVVARRIREELKAQAIDSHIIAGGDLLDALSVGVFSRERFARAQYERVSALGYDTHQRDLPRRQTVYHLMTDRVGAAPDAPRRASCHEIASANYFL